jgi:GNAT superfamily N-acetyltransferase
VSGRADIAVRAAVAGDIDELIRLRAHLLEGGAAAGLPYAATDAAQSAAWRAAYRSWLSERLGNGPEDTGVRVAVVPGAGRLRACATAVVDRRAPSPACPSGLAGWIQSVVTDPRDRGQGLATAVLEHLLGWLRERGADEVVLRTTPAGASLYLRSGFRPSGEELLFTSLRAAEEATPV